MNPITSRSLPWHLGLEEWCLANIGLTRQAVGQQADFAPFEAHKPEKFYEVPVVLMALTSATRALHRSFAEAAELIRASTSGFRAVLVTDLYRSPVLDVCDWPVEQLLAEETWSSHQQSSWLDQAVEHLKAAVGAYGASYVVAPADADSAATGLRHLARVFNAPAAVLNQALTLFTAAEADDAEAPLGFRYGWEALAAGESQRRTFVSAEAEEVQVQLHRGSGCGVVVDPEGRLSPELLQAAQNAGWSTAVLPAEDSSSVADRFGANVWRACADAMHGGGPVLICPAAHPLLLGSAEGRIEPEGSDASPDGRWSIELESVAVVGFSENQAARVFSHLQSVNATLLAR